NGRGLAPCHRREPERHLAGLPRGAGGARGRRRCRRQPRVDLRHHRRLAQAWAPAVRVNCVCPGHVETPLTASIMADPAWRQSMLARYPLGRFGRVDDVAAAILYLASDEASFVTGVALPVDGGYTAI